MCRCVRGLVGGLELSHFAGLLGVVERLLRESRRKVWANAVALSASRRAGGPDGAEHQRQLAELEELSAARVADLMRPGPVLLRLAAGGFGVQLAGAGG